MYKMICLLILTIGYNRLTAQDVSGQLVYQQEDQKWHCAYLVRSAGYAQSNFLPHLNEPYFKGLATQFKKPASTGRSFFLEAVNGLPRDRYFMQSGWVCRQEWKLEKITKVPLRLRLGSKEQVDWLEGKFIHR
jgi:hypothetical protein